MFASSSLLKYSWRQRSVLFIILIQCLILQLESYWFLINVAFWKQSFLTSFFYLYTFYVPKKWLLQYLSQGGILDSSPIKKKCNSLICLVVKCVFISLKICYLYRQNYLLQNRYVYCFRMAHPRRKNSTRLHNRILRKKSFTDFKYAAIYSH